MSGGTHSGSGGASLPIPVSVDDEWLSAIMQSRYPGAVVDGFTAERIGAGVGLVGLLYRITPQYLNEHSSFPATLIVKLPVLIDATRQVAAAYRLYEKEVAFYKDLAHLTKIATPGLIHAAHDPATDNFVLALEDLGHLRSRRTGRRSSSSWAKSSIRGCCRSATGYRRTWRTCSARPKAGP
jgi:hypothetical protein